MPTQAHHVHRKHKNGTSRMTTGVIDGAEALVAATADLGEDKLHDLRTTLKADLESARTRLASLEAKLEHRAKAVDDYVHENPWPAIGVAAAAGVVVGALVFRK